MLKSLLIAISLAVVVLSGLAPGTVRAGAPPAPSGTAWDSAVNSLLATGLYGFDSQNAPGLKVAWQHSDNLYRGLSPDHTPLNGQAITFSYEGSSGLLEFAAGYIFTSQHNNREPGTVFLSVDAEPTQDFDPGRSWYLAFDLSRSYQVDDQLRFSLSSTAMLRRNPFDTEPGRLFSVLFNMPIRYKNYLTITPELQWSRPVSGFDAVNRAAASGDSGEKSSEDVFYGGLSVSFSY